MRALIAKSFRCRCCLISILIYSVTYLSMVRPIASAVGGNEGDRLALLDFKAKITSDPLGVMNSWNDTVHFCKWFGVTCGKRHQRVTNMNLSSLHLAGSISPHIGNLSFLRVLDLKNNSFSHQIPPQIGYLHRLQTLYLYNNSLSGEIPSNLSRCSELIRLSLVNNELVGEIPKELGSLSKLQFLAVGKNQLTGEIPLSLGNLSSLSSLSAAVNNLVGSIPDTLGQLRKLNFLGLSVNQLSGTVPHSIFNLSSITLMDIGDNQLQGNLPSDMFNTLPVLEDLAVALNNFTGLIPTSLANASNMAFLQLQENSFTAKVPSLKNLDKLQLFLIENNHLGTRRPDELNFLCSLSNATNLSIVDISSNNLGGSLPKCISNLSSQLQELSLQNNYITGSIPAGIGNLASLTKIQINNNMLSGSIPETLGSLHDLVVMIFDQNKFSGPIPASLGSLSRLNRLHMADNRLQGSIPSSLGNCKYLQLLDLSRNNLSGSLPTEVIGLSSLSLYLGFSQNRLSGSLPSEVGQLKDIGILDVSSNMLSGEIPSTLASCTSLEYLYMQGNLFQGPIPSNLDSLKGLQVLDVSHNNLSGQIPTFLATFNNLLYLDLSYNDFEGSVPTAGVFTNTSATSLTGNSRICGGIPELHLPICDLKRSKKGKFSSKAKVAIGIVSGLLGAAALVCLLCLLKFKKKRQAAFSSTSTYSLLQVSYQDLHRATSGFSSDNLVGVGSFASVYKGILQDGTLIAVKVINLQRHGAAKSFITECEALRNIRHRNLVKVLTACSSNDYQGNDFKALVYEFMPNGSLEDWLHPESNKDETEQAQRKLNLQQKLDIAIDVASALEYLHYQCEIPIVHSDLKPSNVLLDDEFTAHVGDFGIAKLLLKDNDATNHSSSIDVRGTIGYTAPEYGTGSEVSTKGDVYSYGIFLLEMFTEKRPTNALYSEGWSLHQHVAWALPDKVIEIADSTLVQGEMGPNKEEPVTECLASVFEIGVACSLASPGERMTMHDVTQNLHSIKKKFLGVQDSTRRRRQVEFSGVRVH